MAYEAFKDSLRKNSERKTKKGAAEAKEGATEPPVTARAAVVAALADEADISVLLHPVDGKNVPSNVTVPSNVRLLLDDGALCPKCALKLPMSLPAVQAWFNYIHIDPATGEQVDPGDAMSFSEMEAWCNVVR